MATYNFTIRATDNIGAFSDRSFSLNVQKTRVHRFAVQTPTGFLLSTHGDDWKFEQDVTTAVEAYGNGLWVGSPTQTTIRTSQDGRNWTTKTFPQLPRFATVTGSTPYVVKYIAGKWYMGGTQTLGSGQRTPALWVSDDNMATWALQSRISLLTTSNGSSITDLDFDPTTNTTVLYMGGLPVAPSSTVLYKGVYTKVGDGDWVFNPVGHADAMGVGSLNFTNGLWTLANGSRFVWVSRDGLSWFCRTVGAWQIGNVVSCNGALVASQTPNGSATNHGLMVSTDAGYTWTQKPAFALASQFTNTGRHLAEYNGTIVFTGFGANARQQFIYTTKNMGETWTTHSVATLTGTANVPSKVVSRND